VKFTRCPFFLILGFFVTGVAISTAADRPNVVVILSDDYGYGSAGCYGADPTLVKTPADRKSVV
jgi:hypothetical protein